MSSAQPDTLAQLQQRIRRILELYTSQKTENEQLRKQNKDLDEKVQRDKDQLKELKDKYNKLKVSKTLVASSGDVHEAKLKINRMVREIDKCIALLNRWHRMDDKLSIKINIADRYYPLKIDRKDEEKIRKAARSINEKVLQYKQKYSDKDSQDFLAMAALQFVIKVIDTEGETKDDEVYDKIRELNDELGKVLDWE